jgi:hypothetical protein
MVGFHTCTKDTRLGGMGASTFLIACLMYNNLACGEGLNCASLQYADGKSSEEVGAGQMGVIIVGGVIFWI